MGEDPQIRSFFTFFFAEALHRITEKIEIHRMIGFEKLKDGSIEKEISPLQPQKIYVP